MNKFTMNGVEFCNFGANNYTHGMECITATPKTMSVTTLIEKVLAGEFHGVYLNPSAPCCFEEFYGLFGTPEQYRKVYQEQRDAQIAVRVIKHFGGVRGMVNASNEEHKKVTDEIEKSYKDWWL